MRRPYYVHRYLKEYGLDVKTCPNCSSNSWHVALCLEHYEMLQTLKVLRDEEDYGRVVPGLGTYRGYGYSTGPR